MPDNITEFMWWALNGSILAVAFFIKNDLGEIKKELTAGRVNRENHEQRIIRLEVSCKLRHGSEQHSHMRISDQHLTEQDA